MWLPSVWFLRLARGDTYRAHLYARLAFSALAVFAFTAASTTLLALRPALGSFCLLERLLGIPCPGCGITRSVVLLLHFRFDDAAASNPAGYAVAMSLLARWSQADRLRLLRTCVAGLAKPPNQRLAEFHLCANVLVCSINPVVPPASWGGAA